MKEPSPNIVKSAARVLEIFEMFDEVRRPANIQDVAEHLGYPHSSTGALLKSLATLGYLEFDPLTRAFFPSIRISMLGHWIENESLPVRTVQHLMSALMEATGCTVVTAIQSGVYAQYIKVLQGTSAIRYHVKPGIRRLLHECTLGRTLLAQMDDLSASKLIEQCLVQSEGEKGAVTQVMREIKKIRRQGYAFYSGLVVPDGTLLAVPLPLDLRGRPAAVGIAAPKGQIEARKDELIELISELAADTATPINQATRA